MNEETMAVGDTVYLKSGSPELLVVAISGTDGAGDMRTPGFIKVTWLDAFLRPQKEWFPAVCLTHSHKAP